MSPQDLEIIKRVIQESLRVYAEGQVPFAWVSVIVGGLVAAIGVTWAWGLNQSKKSTEKIAEWATKIEELSNKQRDRDDQRDDATRKRWESVVANINEEHKTQREEWKQRESRLEGSRDAAKLQFENSLKENGEILGRQLTNSDASIDEVSETLEVLIPLLELVKTSLEGKKNE